MSDESTILVEEVSPNGGLVAVVEDDGRTIYLHLVGAEHSEWDTQTVWVRNRAPAPMALDDDWQSAGRGPLLPFSSCTYPAGMPPMDPETLSLIWFPSGDAVALLEHDQVVAVIPPWSGVGGCPGYARDCTAQMPVAWPLGPLVDNPTLQRVRAAREFWEAWSDGSAWRPLQESLLASYADALGSEHASYWSIAPDRWPPRFVARFDAREATILLTGGVSIRPQPQVQRFFSRPGDVAHIELGVALRDPAALDAVIKDLARVTSFPWHHQAFLDAGHTIPGRAFAGYVVRADPPDAPVIRVPNTADSDGSSHSARLLWLVPLDEASRQVALTDGSAALLTRLDQQGRGWTGAS